MISVNRILLRDILHYCSDVAFFFFFKWILAATWEIFDRTGSLLDHVFELEHEVSFQHPQT